MCSCSCAIAVHSGSSIPSLHFVLGMLKTMHHVQAHPAYEEELSAWINDDFPWKIELEALHCLGFSFLTSYLLQSILEENYI
jgi:hypothetical protein